VQRQDTATPATVPRTASCQGHPRVLTRTTLKQATSMPPPSKPLLDAHRTRHDAPPEARFARTAVYSMALCAMPPHVARTVRHACKLLPPWPIKGGADPLAAGGRRTTHTCTLSVFTTILTLASISTSETWRTSLLSRLACSPPLQYSAPSTPLLDVRPRPEPG
jgi:hypothetical protein